jgi:hypothetical protein
MNLFQRDRVNVAAIERYVGEALRELCHPWTVSLARAALFIVVLLSLLICIAFLGLVWSVNENGVSKFHGKAPSWDFTNLWMGARLALSGQIAVLFDVEAYSAAIDRDVVKFLAVSEWSYPPPMLLVGAPFAYLPLNVAHVLWTIVTLALFTGVFRAAGGSVALCALMVMSPAAMFNMGFGQNGALTAALLIGGLVASDRRALLGGALVGLLIIKPHAALLAPVCFLAARNYTAFFAAALSVCLIVLVSIAAFGMEAWIGFFKITSPLMVSYLEEAYLSLYQQSGVSVFLFARSLGADLPTAYAVQAVIAIAAIAVTWLMWRRPTHEPLLRAAATGVLTLLVTPYGYIYELFCLPLAGLLLAMRTQWRSVPAMLVLMLSWAWPSICSIVTVNFLPITPFVVALVAWACWRALQENEDRENEDRERDKTKA